MYGQVAIASQLKRSWPTVIFLGGSQTNFSTWHDIQKTVTNAYRTRNIIFLSYGKRENYTKSKQSSIIFGIGLRLRNIM